MPYEEEDEEEDEEEWPDDLPEDPYDRALADVTVKAGKIATELRKLEVAMRLREARRRRWQHEVDLAFSHAGRQGASGVPGKESIHTEDILHPLKSDSLGGRALSAKWLGGGKRFALAEAGDRVLVREEKVYWRQKREKI